MRDSKFGSIKHTHFIGCEDPRCQNHKEIVHGRPEGNSFVIREVPIHRLFDAGQCANASSDFSGFGKGKNFSAGMNVMDYDIPELVVFLQGDHQFVKDICIDRGVSTKGKCLLEDCELDHNRASRFFEPNLKSNSDSSLGTMESMSFNSDGSECDSKHPCIKDAMKKYGFRNLMIEEELGSGDQNSADHSSKKTTSETLREVFRKEADFSRSFKNWQINSFLGTPIGSRVEFQHCADYQHQFPEAKSMSRPEMPNSQILRFDVQADYPGETSSRAVGPLSVPTSISGSAPHHQSNDSISSTHSFAFPILPTEWSGSPVRMLEADRRQSRKQQWRKICFSCYKC